MIRFYFSFTLKKKDFFKEYVKFIYFIIFKITTIQGYLVMVWLPRHLPKSRDVKGPRASSEHGESTTQRSTRGSQVKAMYGR